MNKIISPISSIKIITLRGIKFVGACIPQTVPEYIYTTLLKPRFLKKPVNALLSFFIPEYLKIGKVEIALNKKDPVLCGALTLGMYEKCELILLQKKLKPGMVFIDIGANIGLYTALGAARVGSKGKVYALEPDKDNFIFLMKTVAKNKLKNVKLFQIALSDHNGKGELYLSDENLADHRIYCSKGEKTRKIIPIDLVMLDSLLVKNQIKKVDFVKMDIQGAEGLAIKGMKKVFENNPNIQIFTEFWPLGIRRTGESPEEFLVTLRRYGFKIFSINRKNGNLELVSDIKEFSNQYNGREFANLYLKKQSSAG